ncbi:Carbohydrate-binding family 9 [Mucilaginibacter mallensis]|uniref:Carbohydrate-binding family 9 n=1 Tax=Mucilaginibacter mallensis TaxID=652787 RepID=A0A1H1QFN8_MUCMA|nr:carbohydrate-binding family 9-like protein [Mucilaginibacter mallensis]SDS22226.1 Carbohydrate-binding family 9 [Mucilaginibacter mallensis]
MNVLNVPYVATALYNNSPDALSGIFSSIEPDKIANEPWPGTDIRPEVTFKMAYGDDALFLKFDVKEKHFRAVHKQINDAVYEDSCVEFFIGFEEEGAYYNFEFNALGTPLVGYGKGKERIWVDPSIVSTIKRTGLINVAEGDVLPHQWDLTVVIPFKVFHNHHITTLQDLKAWGNFYKCGDELAEQHFLCWNNIIADEPNFHLPQYFGELNFN